MCLSPKRILNRTNHWNESKPLYLTVPCGRCDECRNKQRNDWFVRSFFEWQKKGVTTFFYTLTYNNDNLPKYLGIPCFSKRHIQLFLKRLRYYLKGYGITLRYLITSEFGELYKRPHYHAEFFLDKPFSPWSFYRLVEKSWQYGFVKYGDNFGVVSSYHGIAYVTKYITKDESHVDDYFPVLQRAVYSRYNRVLDYLRRRSHDFVGLSLKCRPDTFHFRMYDIHTGKDIDKFHIHYAFAARFLKKINDIVLSRIPFHLQSTKLGVGEFEKHLSAHDFLTEQVSVNLGGLIRSYSFPRYFKRMFWYDCVENELDGKKTSFVLNDEGVKHILERDQLNIERKITEYKTTLANSRLVDGAMVLMLRDVNKCQFNTDYDVKHWMQHFDMDLEIMAIYDVYFRNRVNFCEDIMLNADTVRDSYMDYADFCLTASFDYDLGKIWDKYCDVYKTDLFNFVLWNAHPFFEPYERALQILETLSLSTRVRMSSAQAEKDKNVRKLREILNKL